MFENKYRLAVTSARDKGLEKVRVRETKRAAKKRTRDVIEEEEVEEEEEESSVSEAAALDVSLRPSYVSVIGSHRGKAFTPGLLRWQLSNALSMLMEQWQKLYPLTKRHHWRLH